MPPRRDHLDAQENLACVYYVCGAPDVRGNMTESYVQAGYSPNGNRATQAKSATVFFARDLVKLRVAQLAVKMQTRIVATAEDLIEEMDAVIFADPADAFDIDGTPLPIHKMPRRFRRAIAGWEDGGKKIRLVPKTPLIQARGEMFGLFERLVEKQINALPERARLDRVAALLTQALQRNPAKEQTVEVAR